MAQRSHRLPSSVLEAVAAADLVLVSAASAWEAAIKTALGRLELPESLEAGVLASGFERLPITFAHAEAAAALPPHHRDPVDRMLVAQARLEDLVLVTHDRRLASYQIETLWS